MEFLQLLFGLLYCVLLELLQSVCDLDFVVVCLILKLILCTEELDVPLEL